MLGSRQPWWRQMAALASSPRWQQERGGAATIRAHMPHKSGPRTGKGLPCPATVAMRRTNHCRVGLMGRRGTYTSFKGPKVDPHTATWTAVGFVLSHENPPPHPKWAQTWTTRVCFRIARPDAQMHSFDLQTVSCSFSTQQNPGSGCSRGTPCTQTTHTQPTLWSQLSQPKPSVPTLPNPRWPSTTTLLPPVLHSWWQVAGGGHWSWTRRSC